MSGEFTNITTANDATIIRGIVSEGQIQVRDGGDLNLNLHELNGRAVVLVALADGAAGDDNDTISATARDELIAEYPVGP